MERVTIAICALVLVGCALPAEKLATLARSLPAKMEWSYVSHNLWVNVPDEMHQEARELVFEILISPDVRPSSGIEVLRREAIKGTGIDSSGAEITVYVADHGDHFYIENVGSFDLPTRLAQRYRKMGAACGKLLQQRLYDTQAQCEMSKGNYHKAISDLADMIQVSPDDAIAYANRGYAYSQIDDYARAATDFDKALQLDQTLPRAQRNLAWLLATCPDKEYRNGKRAVELATKVCETSKWNDHVCLSVLAAAYAEIDDFQTAIRWQTKAVDLLKDGDAAALQEAKERLELYQKKQPYRSESL